MSIITFLSGAISKRLPASINSGDGSGVFDDLDAKASYELFPNVSQAAALRLSAVWACVNTRAETIGSLPVHLRDEKKNVLKDHPVYGLLHDLPNSYMTSADFGSMSVANVDMLGNQLSIIARRTRDRSPLSINPLPPHMGYDFRVNREGRPSYWINGMDYNPDDVLHMKGFSIDGFNGLSRLSTGRQVLSAQEQADTAMIRAFQQGLKIGGFFEADANRENMDEAQYEQFQRRMAQFNRPENMAKWMPLPPGLKPVQNTSFKLSTGDVELLASRNFGIEEICRLFQVPPSLIGHTSKSSSWASSAEQLNLHFLMYSVQPTLVRREKAYWHKLLTPAERRLYDVKHSVEGLLRSDVKTRQAFYASGLQNGYLSQNDVRDMEERPGVPDGDVYRVQLNMSSSGADDADKKTE